MARQARQQRRAARANESGAEPKVEREPQDAPARPRIERTQVRAAQVERQEPHEVPGRGVARFIGESWAELKKVEWPNRDQVVQGTAVVLIACLVVGVYLYALDQGFKHLIKNVFLGQ